MLEKFHFVKRFVTEAIQLLIGIPSLLFILMQTKFESLFSHLLQLSFFERLIIFGSIAFIFSKINMWLGRSFIKILIWIFFKKDKVSTSIKWLNRSKDLLSNTTHQSTLNTNIFLSTDLLSYLSNNRQALERYEKYEQNLVFWDTLFGTSCSLSLISWYEFDNKFEILFILIFISFAAAVLCGLNFKKFQETCQKTNARNNLVLTTEEVPSNTSV